MVQSQLIDSTDHVYEELIQNEIKSNKIKTILSEISNICLDELYEIDGQDIKLSVIDYNDSIKLISTEPSLCFWHETTKDLYIIILSNLKIFCVHEDNWELDIEDECVC